MSTLTENVIGLENIEYEVLLMMVEKLNGVLESVHLAWEARDKELSAVLNRPEIFTVDPDYFQPHNMHKGSIPQLVDARLDELPALAVFATHHEGLPDQGDQYDVHDVDVFAEIFVKGETLAETNSRVRRVSEAVQRVIATDTTLSGTVHQMQTPPEVGLSDPEDRTAEVDGRGEKWYWAGARLEYSCTTYTGINV